MKHLEEFDKEEFLKSEFGVLLKGTVHSLDYYIWAKDRTSDADKRKKLQKSIDEAMARWSVFQVAMKHFYNLSINFSRTEDYFGVCDNYGKDWLFVEFRTGVE